MSLLSVVIITHNEAKNIARCIQSAQQVADEIIVVDSFSTDHTIEIATKLGAIVHQRTFDNYSDQKNAGNAIANYPFILSLDADEELSMGLIEEIVAQKEQKFPHKAYNFPRLTEYCGTFIHHAGWYPDRSIRLWQKNQARWQGLVHEKLVFVEEPRVEWLKNPILHYSFPDLHTHFTKINHYSTLAAKAMQQKGKRVHWSYAFLNAGFTFVKKYIFQRGFLEGYVGFLVCYFSALGNFLKYNKLYFLQKETKKIE